MAAATASGKWLQQHRTVCCMLKLLLEAALAMGQLVIPADTVKQLQLDKKSRVNKAKKIY